MRPRVLIKAREGDDPCNCGCGGDDPWHDSHYRRVVRGVKLTRKDLGNGRFTVAVGTARFPWGPETVRQVAQVIDGVEYTVGWEIVK